MPTVNVIIPSEIGTTIKSNLFDVNKWDVNIDNVTIVKNGLGVISTHDIVTLGVANGLYLTQTQQLNLALATTTVAGAMSASDKVKLNSLSNYTHPTGDGNLHVPATGTTNQSKFLMAGATAGSLSWQQLNVGYLSDFSSAVNTLIAQGQVASNYWTKTGNNLSYIAGNVGVGAEPTTNKFFVYQTDLLGQFIIGHAGLSRTFIDQDEFYVRSGSDKKNKLFMANGNTQHYGHFTVNSFTNVNFGKIRLSAGTASNSGYLEVVNASNLRLGYIGFDNVNLNYIAENNAMHYFGGGNVLIGYNQSRGNYKLQVEGAGIFRNSVANSEIIRLIDSTDSTYTSISNVGVIFSRLTSYISPAGDNNQTLAIGYGVTSQKWNLINIDGNTVSFVNQANYGVLKTTSAGYLQQATSTDISDILGDAYIKNQFTSAQSANMWISGNANINGKLLVGSTTQDSVLRVQSAYGGMRISYNNTSANYFDGDVNIFRNNAGTEVMRTQSLKLLIGTAAERGGHQLQVLKSAIITDIVISNGASGASSSTFVGNGAGLNATASGNSGFGNGALFTASTAPYNSAFGVGTLRALTTGTGNDVSGYYSGQKLTIANYNVLGGFYALGESTNSSRNIYLGYYAGQYQGNSSTPTVESAQYNVGIGYQVLVGNSNGINPSTYNVAMSYLALQYLESGTHNIAIGSQSMRYSVTSNHNVAVGYGTNSLNTSASYSVAIGSLAMYNSASNYNTAIGGYSQNQLKGVGSGMNASIGYFSLRGGATIDDNIGIQNTAIGAYAIQSLSSGNGNSSLGYYSGALLTTGSRNVLLGAYSGQSLTTGSNNVIVGSYSGARIATLANYMIFSDGLGNERFSIDNSGYMLINRISVAGAYHLQVNGTIQQETVKSKMLYANSLGAIVGAVDGTDYISPTTIANFQSASNYWTKTGTELSYSIGAVNVANVFKAGQVDTPDIYLKGPLTSYRGIGFQDTNMAFYLYQTLNDRDLRLAFYNTAGAYQGQILQISNINGNVSLTTNVNVSGYLLVGRTSQVGSYAFQVNGTIQQEAVKNKVLYAGTDGELRAATDLEIASILGTGSFIQNQTALVQSGGFSISGNGYTQAGFFASGNVSSGSDRRIKSNIKPLVKIASKLGKLTAQTYLKQGVEDLGYIAQDLQVYFPELVTTSPNGMLGINYGGVATLALQLGKENSSEIEKLKKEVKKLKQTLINHGITD